MDIRSQMEALQNLLESKMHEANNTQSNSERKEIEKEINQISNTLGQLSKFI